jgi:hypothetical protein
MQQQLFLNSAFAASTHGYFLPNLRTLDSSAVFVRFQSILCPNPALPHSQELPARGQRQSLGKTG